MTVPFNPGYPPVQQQPPQQQAPVYPQQAAPQAQPPVQQPGGWAPNMGAPAPIAPQPSAMFTAPPQQQAPQFNPGAPPPLDFNARIPAVAGVPSWMQGKTLAEVAQQGAILGEAVQDYYRRFGPPGARQGQQQGQPPQQGGQAPQQGQPQGQQQPAIAALGGLIDEKLAPVMEMNANIAVQNIGAQMSQMYPDFGQFAADIYQSIQQLPAQQRMDPQNWQNLYFWKKGQAMSQGRGQQPQRQPAPAPQAPPAGGWFSEGPSAPGAPIQNAVDPRLGIVADGFQIPMQELSQWGNNQIPEEFRNPRVAGGYGGPSQGGNGNGR